MLPWLKSKKDRSIVYPRLPQGVAVHVIGDIHGRSDLLDGVHARIDQDNEARDFDSITIYLGDYVDRGPDSRGVIDRLIERSRNRHTIFLRGNHEKVFSAFIAGEVDPEEWRHYGGHETLLSYGLDVRALARAPREDWVTALRGVIPPEHRSFLNTLSDSFLLEDYFFVHAGVRPGVPLDEQTPDDLLWVRDVFLGDDRDHGKIVVHGHTPTMEVEFLANRINLDTGAYMTNRLSCLVIDAKGPRLLPD